MAQAQRRDRGVVEDAPPVPGDRLDPVRVRDADARARSESASRHRAGATRGRRPRRSPGPRRTRHPTPRGAPPSRRSARTTRVRTAAPATAAGPCRAPSACARTRRSARAAPPGTRSAAPRSRPVGPRGEPAARPGIRARARSRCRGTRRPAWWRAADPCSEPPRRPGWWGVAPAGAAALRLGGDRIGVRGSVVDDDHRPAVRQRSQARAQLIAASVHGNHDRQLGGSVFEQRRVGIEQPGVEQPSRQQPLIARVADRPAQRPSCDEPGAARREREQPQGGAAEQQPAVADRPQIRGRAQPPTCWDRGPGHGWDKTKVDVSAAPTDADGLIGPKSGQDDRVSAYDERPWLSLYAEGRPHEIERGAREHARRVRRHGGALTRTSRRSSTSTPRSPSASSTRLATRSPSGCVEQGFEPGDRLGIYLQNVPQFLIAMLATWKAGGIMVSISPMLKHKELSATARGLGCERAGDVRVAMGRGGARGRRRDRRPDRDHDVRAGLPRRHAAAARGLAAKPRQRHCSTWWS